MLVADAQKEVQTASVGGFWGQLVSSVIWLLAAALGTWGTPRAAIVELVLCGFLIFPATQLLLRLAGGPASLSRENPLGKLAMQIAFTLPMTMLLLAPVGAFRLNWFFPGVHDSAGGALPAVHLPLWDADVHSALRDSCGGRRGDCRVLFRFVQYGGVGDGRYAFCVCVAWADVGLEGVAAGAEALVYLVACGTTEVVP